MSREGQELPAHLLLWGGRADEDRVCSYAVRIGELTAGAIVAAFLRARWLFFAGALALGEGVDRLANLSRSRLWGRVLTESGGCVFFFAFGRDHRSFGKKRGGEERLTGQMELIDIWLKINLVDEGYVLQAYDEV